jgi:hypothetical protein
MLGRKHTGGPNPSERFLSNTGGADVSIRTLESRPSNRRNPRPRRQRISQATGIGNSVIIIAAEAELREPPHLAGGEPGAPARPGRARLHKTVKLAA